MIFISVVENTANTIRPVLHHGFVNM